MAEETPWKVAQTDEKACSAALAASFDVANKCINIPALDQAFARHRHEAQAPLVEALRWISKIADQAFEKDHKLRAGGARVMRRIADKADDALARVESGQ